MTEPLREIIVSKEAFDAQGKDSWELVSDVAVFVSEMLDTGAFRADEIPQKAVQVSQAAYYLGEVLNGGHSQFMRNSRTGGKDPIRIRNAALAGLRAMGATGHAELLANMIAWAEANPQEGTQQAGSNSAAALDEIDNRFFKLNRETPMDEISAAWIRNWPELVVTAEGEYDRAIEKARQHNPYREQRLSVRQIHSIRETMYDRPILSLRMAGCACTPQGICISQFWPNALIKNIEGVDCNAWGLVTDIGQLVGIITESWSEIYARPEDDKPGHAYSVGRILGRVSTSEVDALLKLLKETDAPAAAHLLLKTAGISHNIKDIVLARRDGINTGWIAMIDDVRGYLVVHSAENSKLFDLTDHTLLATVTTEDVKNFVGSLPEAQA